MSNDGMGETNGVSPVDDAPQSRPDGPLRLLIIEDDAEDARFVQHTLRENFTDASDEHVSSLEDALTHLEHHDVDIVVLDPGLADASGTEALMAVQDAAPGVGIVVLTGRGGHDAGVRAINLGANDYLLKDEVDAEMLARSIRHAEARQEARRLSQKLEQSRRLAALGQLSAGLAHEINNPTAYIRSNLEFLQEDLQALVDSNSDIDKDIVSGMRACLSDAHDGVERIQELVRDISVYARYESAPSSVIELCDVIHDALEATPDLLEQPANLHLEVRDGLFVAVDRDRLQQTFEYLLRNAAESLPDGEKGTMTIRCRADESRAIIEIEDSGEGISEEHLPSIFEPFYTTKARGTGLGLSIAARLIEAHDGSIEVTSELEKGTTVRVTLPLVDAPDTMEMEPDA